jgi:glutamine synthetase
MTPAEVLKLIKDKHLLIVDIKFMDLPGLWQHCSFPTHELTESSFTEGYGFDGSSIRGWTSIHESDMLVVPDASTACIDPIMSPPTLHLVGNVVDPMTRTKYERDPRYIAQKAEAYLARTGIGEIAHFGSEAEFFVFDDIRFDQQESHGFYFIDSIEGRWNTGRDERPNLGYKPRFKEGYFPVPPTDAYQDLRSEMLLVMEECGLTVEAHHHEVATAGQMEIDIRYAELTRAADNLMLYKYIVKNIARRHNKTVTFMPKPIYNDNGSGMHCHQSLWKQGQPLFAGNGYAGLSEMALHYIGGLLKHAPSVVAFAAPTTNSYKRLVPGFEAPVNLAYSRRNRSAAVRIPMYSTAPKSKRIEFRPPDPSCNPYLAFAAMLMAGLDGIQNRIDAGEPLDRDIYGLSPEELTDVKRLPDSLEGSLNALEQDHEFLLKGEVFTEDVIRTWIEYKRRNEVDAIRLRPHPYEFALYYDI